MIFETKEAKNLYQVLGVPPGIPQGELAGVVERLRRIFDPSTYPEGLPGLQALAGHRLEEIEAAYRVLGDPEQREAYDASLALPANVIPLGPRRSLDRVLTRSVASVGEELLSQDPSLHWRRGHAPGFDLVATADRPGECHQLRFRIVPRLTIEEFREFLFTVQDMLLQAEPTPRKEHLTFLVAAEILEDQEEVHRLLESFHQENWVPLRDNGARARIFVLQGPSGHVLAPGGVNRDRPSLNPRRLIELDREELLAA